MNQECSSGGVIYRARDGVIEVLLMRVRKDKYELPKGHIEAGETAQEAALRECYEETGFAGELAIVDFLGELEYSFDSAYGIITKKVTYYSIRISKDGEFNKPGNTHELRWTKSTELGSISMVNESLKEIIARLDV